jgi:integrase/recombinase XerD
MKVTLENLKRDLALKGYAQSTQERYYRAGERLMKRFGQPAAQIEAALLREYVQDLQCTLSPFVFRQELCGLLFLYRKTLGLPERVSFISLSKKYSPTPVVLSVKEVHALLNHIHVRRYRMVAMVAYGCGLRISEALALECRDVDGPRGILRVRHGKGNVARETRLSSGLYFELRQYWAEERPLEPYLFASRSGQLPKADTIRKALKKAAQAAGIKKAVRPHLLRHCFATHLLEQGVDSHVVSKLLGHKSLNSTQRYAQVTRPIIRQTPSPLDLLPHRRR